jgi:hypothetical protein
MLAKGYLKYRAIERACGKGIRYLAEKRVVVSGWTR